MLTRCCTALLLLASLAACGGDAGTDASPSSSPSSSSGSSSPAGSSSDEATETPSATPDPSTPTPDPTADGTRIVVDDSEFGPMLFDAAGQAIYLFDVETTSQARCYDVCAEAWPPVLTTGVPVAGAGVDQGLLATTKRTDGTRQVTYAGHPLYFYAHEGPNEVTCHDVFLNGGNWYVVQPDGDAAPPG